MQIEMLRAEVLCDTLRKLPDAYTETEMPEDVRIKIAEAVETIELLLEWNKKLDSLLQESQTQIDSMRERLRTDVLDYIHKLNEVNRRYDRLSREASYMRKQLKDREDIIKQQADTIDCLMGQVLYIPFPEV